MKTINEAIKDGTLPQDNDCYRADDKYVVGTVHYPLTMTLKELKKSLEERKKSYPDFKALSHALRAGLQLKEIYETGDLQYPLKDRDFLLAVKQGKLDFTTVVAPALENVIEEVEQLAEKSDLPAKVDRAYWDNFVVDVYKGRYND